MVNRIFILTSKNFNDKIPQKNKLDLIDTKLIKNVEKLRDDSIKNENLKIHDGIESAISIFRLINKFLEDKVYGNQLKRIKI